MKTVANLKEKYIEMKYLLGRQNMHTHATGRQAIWGVFGWASSTQKHPK